MDLEALRKVGLSAGEIKVYEALLDIGSSSLNRIHEQTGIERRNIYDILNKLIERGLVTYLVENKKRRFQLTPPSKIVGYVEEQIAEISQTKAEVESLVPLIEKQFAAKREKISAEVYRGFEGIKAVWEDMLNYKDMRWIGSGRHVPETLPQWFTNWNRRRVKLGIPWYNILRHEMQQKLKRPLELEYMRFLPPEFSGNPTVIGIFGPKVATFLFGKEFFAFIIDSKDIADSYRRYHAYLWDYVAKELGTGRRKP